MSVHLPRFLLIRVFTPTSLNVRLAEVPCLVFFVLVETLRVDHSELITREDPGTI